MHFSTIKRACELNRGRSRVANFRLALCVGLVMTVWTAPQWLSAQQTDQETEAPDVLAVNSNEAMDQALQFVLLAKGDYLLNSDEGSGQAMLGVHVRKADETLRSQLGVQGKFGLVVEHVTENSSAAESRLQLHDVLLKLDGQLLANLEQFQSLIDSRKPGDGVVIDYYRNGTALRVTVELTERKEINVDSAILDLERYHDSLLYDPHLPAHKRFLQFHDCKSCHNSVDPAPLDLIRFRDAATDILGDRDKK